VLHNGLFHGPSASLVSVVARRGCTVKYAVVAFQWRPFFRKVLLLRVVLNVIFVVDLCLFGRVIVNSAIHFCVLLSLGMLVRAGRRLTDYLLG